MNRTTQRHLRTHAAILAMLVLGAPAVRAQVAESPRGPANALARSDELQRAAQGLFSSPEHWQDAAALLTHAARLRPAGDPEKQRMLATAARLYAYRGNSGHAIYWMQKGAEQALAGGDVITAAQTYTQAAYLAGEKGDYLKAQKLAQRVETLAGSPLLSADQRESLLRPFSAGALAAARAAAGQAAGQTGGLPQTR